MGLISAFFDLVGTIIDLITTIFDRQDRKALFWVILTLFISGGLVFLVYRIIIYMMIR